MKNKEILLKEKVIFNFTHRNDAERVALALCSAGFFIQIIAAHMGQIEVRVYEFKN